MKIPPSALFAFSWVLGCASTGTSAHDMSGAQHTAAANAHESEAAQHTAQFEREAHEARARCVTPGTPLSAGEICWTSVSNPTASHLAEAERHRRMAAEHRAASQALRDAEARACSGLRASDRDTSPFAHREDIAEVTPLTIDVALGRTTVSRIVGATVVFRARPGLTAEWLQRLTDCHLARAASLGHTMPEMPYCPLVPRGVTARVSSVGNGFAVAVRGEDEGTIAEIRRRAESLVGRTASEPTDRR